MAGKQEHNHPWQGTYYSRLGEGLVDPVEDRFWFFCPCCGYPTLQIRGGHDICSLCGWQDDGQDDPHADEYWGGPNGVYTLTESRENFRRYWVKYNPDTDSRKRLGNTYRTLQAKKEMVAAFEALRNADEAESINLWKMVKRSRTTIRQELSRKVREYAQQHKSA